MHSFILHYQSGFEKKKPPLEHLFLGKIQKVVINLYVLFSSNVLSETTRFNSFILASCMYELVK